MPPRDTGSAAGAGDITGTSGTWGTEGTQPWQAASTGAQGQYQSETAGHGHSPVEQARDSASGKANEVAGQATAAVDQGIDRASAGLDRAADMIRERGEQMGGGSGAGSSAAMVADKLDAASTYLRDKDSAQLIADLERVVRQKPTQSLLVAAGVGFLLSKILR
jgi:ElaB/YqjD/DUF883 family membrane-anchored ribosome-binding protein